MRRAFLAVALGSVLLTATACDSDAETPAAAPAASTPSPAATIAEPDYSANTKLVCGKVEKVFDADLESFGTQMGKMIAHKEARLPAPILICGDERWRIAEIRAWVEAGCPDRETWERRTTKPKAEKPEAKPKAEAKPKPKRTTTRKKTTEDS